MKEIKPTEAHICVSMARDGGLLLFQGYYKQALYLARDDVARFVENPAQAKLLVIPPLAALALHCYTSLERIESISVRSHPLEDDLFTLTIRASSGLGIRYVSSHEDCPCARVLQGDRIGVVVTPRMAAIVDSSGSKPLLAQVVQVPTDEVPNYKNRFAHAPNLLSQAVVQSAGEMSAALRYAN